MKIDGSQQRSAGMIAKYIRHYMRFYDVRIFYDPFCGFGHIYSQLYNYKKSADFDFKALLSDLNPYIIAVLYRLWSGEEISDVLPRERYLQIIAAFKKKFKADGQFMNGIDGYEDWEIGCALVLGTLHQNPSKGFIGEEQYSKNINDLKEVISKVPRPYILQAKDYMTNTEPWINGPKIIYCDFPEPTAKNYFPWNMFFDRDEFFKFTRQWEDGKNIVIYSSKYFPDNGQYELIYQAGEQNLYIGKKWYVEDILNAAPGYKRVWARPARTISEANARRKGRAVPCSSGKRRPL